MPRLSLDAERPLRRPDSARHDGPPVSARQPHGDLRDGDQANRDRGDGDLRDGDRVNGNPRDGDRANRDPGDGNPAGSEPVTGLPARPLRVAAVQAEAVPGEVARNAMTASKLLARAAGKGVRLAVFPELFLPAYDPPALALRPRQCDVSADEDDVVADLRLDPVREAARRHQVLALIGASVSRVDGARRCSALLVDTSGLVRAVYDKLNLCGGHEKALFTPGDRGCTLAVDDWLLGIGICYDGCFPEHGRAAALAGAHGYLCPSGYVIGSHPRRDLYYPARALDNTMYVVFANPVGGVAPWQFSGGAAVYDPQGQSVGQAPGQREAVVAAELDPGELGRVRAAHAMLSDVIAHGANVGSHRTTVPC